MDLITHKEQKILYTFRPFSNYLNKASYTVEGKCSSCNECGCASCQSCISPPSCSSCG